MHPACKSARKYLDNISRKELTDLHKTFAQSALGGNIIAKNCMNTIIILLSNEDPSDIDIIALAWMISTSYGR